jgi:DNA-binding FadR family transcriptional regulator
MHVLEPIQQRSVHEEIQDHIKEFILGNDMQPGDPLPTEAQLAEQLRVSRAVLREALRSLESLGLIHSRRGEGRFVSDFSMRPILENLGYSMLIDPLDVLEIVDVRQCLETGFIGTAIESMDDETLAELQARIDTMRQRAALGESFLEHDHAFHCAIYQRTDNRLLKRLLVVFREVYKNLRDESLLIPTDPVNEVANHEAILEAIDAKDAQAAQQRIIDHFTDIKRRLEAAFQHNQGAG